jgi:hypothetical protein
LEADRKKKLSPPRRGKWTNGIIPTMPTGFAGELSSPAIVSCHDNAGTTGFERRRI